MLSAQVFASSDSLPVSLRRSLYLSFSLSSVVRCSSTFLVRICRDSLVSETSLFRPLNALPNACPILSNALDIRVSVFSASSCVVFSCFRASLLSTTILPHSLKISVFPRLPSINFFCRTELHLLKPGDILPDQRRHIFFPDVLRLFFCRTGL